MEKYPKKRAYAHPKLKEFLVEKGAYKQFLENCKKEKHNKGKKRLFKRIDEAFIWSNTKQGRQYWKELSRELNE